MGLKEIIYVDDSGKERSVSVSELRDGEWEWIGARKANMEKEKFKKRVKKVLDKDN